MGSEMFEGFEMFEMFEMFFEFLICVICGWDQLLKFETFIIHEGFQRLK